EAPGVQFLCPLYQPFHGAHTEPGAQLRFIVDGERAPTYADGDFISQLPYPIIADGGGVFPPIYLADEAYTVQLTDAAGNVVFGPPNNPVPTLAALSPDEAGAGAGAFTLTATGTGFVED